MPNPVTPASVKAIIPSLSGSLCERLQKLFQFPEFLYRDQAYKYTEAGTISDAYKADICALSCLTGTGNGGGGTVNPNMNAPTGVNATDGSYSDKIRVSWNAVVVPTGIDPVTQYKVYRSLATNTDPNNAELVGTVTAPTTIFDDPIDTDLVVGTTYNYWVRATNGTDVSAYSGDDVGSASAPTGDIDAVSDLRASYGFVFVGGDQIALVWTPPAGAVKYDIYRGTTSVFADATKIYSNIAPVATTSITPSTPVFWDNVGELLLYDVPPSGNVDYYYWVVAHKTSPPAVSTESNTALGRSKPPSTYNLSSEILTYTADTYTVPAGRTKMWAKLQGGGAAGAGGGLVYGGGGGGAGAIVVEAFTVAPTDVITLVTTGTTPDTGQSPNETNGGDGTKVELKINGVTVMTANGGKGGEYDASGGGLGGDGASGSGGGTPTYGPIVYDGKPGLPSVGANGGRSGYVFGARRLPQSDGFAYAGIRDGNAGGSPGSGSKAEPISVVYAIGGKGTTGQAELQFGT